MDAHLESQITQMESSLSGVEELLELLMRQPLENLEDKAKPLDMAKLDLLCAYSLNTLYYVYLKTFGIPTDEHEIMGELERVKAYTDKLRNFSIEPRKRPSTQALNKAAANRFILHELDHLSREHKAEVQQLVRVTRAADPQPSRAAARKRRPDVLPVVTSSVKQRAEDFLRSLTHVAAGQPSGAEAPTTATAAATDPSSDGGSSDIDVLHASRSSASAGSTAVSGSTGERKASQGGEGRGPAKEQGRRSAKKRRRESRLASRETKGAAGSEGQETRDAAADDCESETRDGVEGAGVEDGGGAGLDAGTPSGGRASGDPSRSGKGSNVGSGAGDVGGGGKRSRSSRRR